MSIWLAMIIVPIGALAWAMFTFAGTVAGIVFTAIAFVILYLFYRRESTRVQETTTPSTPSRQLHRQRLQHRQRGTTQEPVTIAMAMAAHPREPTLTRGLRSSAIADLPVYVYERSGSGDKCSVCLGEMQHGEIVKQLPTCTHLFHEGCIDMWLSSNTTCPVCRSRVDGEMPTEVAMRLGS